MAPATGVSMRPIRWTSAAALWWCVGCVGEEPTAAGAVPVAEGSVGSECRADADCEDAAYCGWGVCVGGDADALGQVGDVDDATRAAVARACARLHGDCADVCDNIFVECYGDFDQCVEQWSADYLEDFSFPIVDRDLAAQCAGQIDEQACTDLRPDSLECEYAIVETCPGDDDGFGAPYSPFRAASLSGSGTFEVMLCERVTEYYRLQLAQGQGVRITALDEDADAPELELYRLVGGTATKLESIEQYIDPDGDERSAAAALAGEYLLSVRAYSGTQRFSFELSIE